ncbi:MAG: hypothetical protein GXY44_13045 [Phycisphaerales bacterium]|nr:hypothetical protein [Phycisphaerales bacterium]
MRFITKCTFVFRGIVLAGLFGCHQPEPLHREQLEQGCVFLLPGVEGGAWQFQQTTQGLRDAGLNQAIDVIEWGVRPFGSMINLTDLKGNRRRAVAIAEHIAQYQRNFPERPTTLLGFSGGGGLAVLTAEALPEGIRVDRLILVSAVISPQYDLSKAAVHSRKKIISFYSNRDWLIIGAGTTLFGTIDRQYTSSAGHVGFQDDQGQLRTDGLVQIAWRPEWRQLGNNGGHLGWLAREWARDILAPQIDPTVNNRQ